MKCLYGGLPVALFNQINIIKLILDYKDIKILCLNNNPGILPREKMNIFEIATYHDTTDEEYAQISKFKLYSDLSVKYSWWVPQANSFSQETRDFQELPEKVQVELAKIAQKHQDYHRLSSNVRETLEHSL
ncbi:MAG: hypothetical protein ACFB02_18505 [Mastigocoleus sp.]